MSLFVCLSVCKLGKTLDFRLDFKSESCFKVDIFHPTLDRVKGVQKLYESSYLCEESLDAKFHTPSSFPSC